MPTIIKPQHVEVKWAICCECGSMQGPIDDGFGDYDFYDVGAETLCVWCFSARLAAHIEAMEFDSDGISDGTEHAEECGS